MPARGTGPPKGATLTPEEMDLCAGYWPSQTVFSFLKQRKQYVPYPELVSRLSSTMHEGTLVECLKHLEGCGLVKRQNYQSLTTFRAVTQKERKDRQRYPWR